MNIVIIEDEMYAARRLEALIREYGADIEIVAWLESVQDSVAWFLSHPQPDLIFLDIHLEDDLSFAVFDAITVTCPIIFTTATDELAIKAFHTKGIDYLHKPIVQTELFGMLDKYHNPANYEHKVIDASFFRDLKIKKN